MEINEIPPPDRKEKARIVRTNTFTLRSINNLSSPEFGTELVSFLEVNFSEPL
jgi:hypothetical protein